MVWTDSQDYGVDEILSHPFTLTPPVQHAACALHFEEPVPSRINEQAVCCTDEKSRALREVMRKLRVVRVGLM